MNILSVTAITTEELKALKDKLAELEKHTKGLSVLAAQVSWEKLELEQKVKTLRGELDFNDAIRKRNDELEAALQNWIDDNTKLHESRQETLDAYEKRGDEIIKLKAKIKAFENITENDMNQKAALSERIAVLKTHIRDQNNADVIARAVRIILRADKKGMNPGEESVSNAMAGLDELEQDAKYQGR